MLYYLVLFKEYFSPLNVLNYITFRAGGAVITALALTWFFGPAFIRFFRKNKITQPIRSDGPPTHHAKSDELYGVPYVGVPDQRMASTPVCLR